MISRKPTMEEEILLNNIKWYKMDAVHAPTCNYLQCNFYIAITQNHSKSIYKHNNNIRIFSLIPAYEIGNNEVSISYIWSREGIDEFALWLDSLHMNVQVFLE